MKPVLSSRAYPSPASSASHPPAAPSPAQSQRLPFNSLRLAADYNLYRLKAHLSDSLSLTSTPPRPPIRRYSRPATLRGRSAPVSTAASSDDEEDSSACTSRAFHSSASHTPPAGMDDCAYIPRFVYEDALRQVVEQMDRASLADTNSRSARINSLPPLASAAPSPHSSPVSPVARTVSRAARIVHRLQQPSLCSEQEMTVTSAEWRSGKRPRVAAPIPRVPTVAPRPTQPQPQQQQPRSSIQAVWQLELTWHEEGREGVDEADEAAAGASLSAVRVGMDLRRVKLLEMAKMELPPPHSALHSAFAPGRGQ